MLRAPPSHGLGSSYSASLPRTCASYDELGSTTPPSYNGCWLRPKWLVSIRRLAGSPTYFRRAESSSARKLGLLGQQVRIGRAHVATDGEPSGQLERAVLHGRKRHEQ